MNSDTNPLEAGLDYFIKLNKVFFVHFHCINDTFMFKTEFLFVLVPAC